MQRRMLKSKIHRATVTEAIVHYEGSITIDAGLMDAADIREHEEVHIWDVTNGARLTTYALRGEEGSGTITMNGAAALLVHRGDLIIIASYAEVEEEKLAGWRPRQLFVDAKNRIVTGEGKSGEC